MEGRSPQEGIQNSPDSLGPRAFLWGAWMACAGVERPGWGGPLKGQQLRIPESVENFRPHGWGWVRIVRLSRTPLTLFWEVMGTGPSSTMPRVQPPLELRRVGPENRRLSVSPSLQPAELWLTSALASDQGVAAGPGDDA